MYAVKTSAVVTFINNCVHYFLFSVCSPLWDCYLRWNGTRWIYFLKYKGRESKDLARKPPCKTIQNTAQRKEVESEPFFAAYFDSLNFSNLGHVLWLKHRVVSACIWTQHTFHFLHLAPHCLICIWNDEMTLKFKCKLTAQIILSKTLFISIAYAQSHTPGWQLTDNMCTYSDSQKQFWSCCCCKD